MDAGDDGDARPNGPSGNDPSCAGGAAGFALTLMKAFERRSSQLTSSRRRQMLRRSAHLLTCGEECDSGEELEREVFQESPAAAVDGVGEGTSPSLFPPVRYRVSANQRRRERTDRWRKDREDADRGERKRVTPKKWVLMLPVPDETFGVNG